MKVRVPPNELRCASVLFYLNSTASSHSLVLIPSTPSPRALLFALLCFHFVPCHESTSPNGIHRRLPVRRFSVIVIPDRPIHSSQEGHGDFNDNANRLWSLYAEKARDHDDTKIEMLTEGMNGVLLFVRSRGFLPASHLCV